MARCTKGSHRYRELRRIKARREARAARRRREALQHWTTHVLAGAGAVRLERPRDLAGLTRSGRGTARRPGAAVRLKATFNRRLLGQAPAAAAAMLAYKAAEAGIEIDTHDYDDHLWLGQALVDAARINRDLRKEVGRARRAG